MRSNADVRFRSLPDPTRRPVGAHWPEYTTFVQVTGPLKINQDAASPQRVPWYFLGFGLRVEFLFKKDSGYPKDTGVNKPWQSLGIPFAIKPIGQLHQSPPSPIPGDLGRGPSHQSHVLEHRDTYGQAQVCSNGHQGSSVDRPCQPSFCWIKFWHVWNLLPQSIRLRLSVLVRYRAGQGEWSLS